MVAWFSELWIYWVCRNSSYPEALIQDMCVNTEKTQTGSGGPVCGPRFESWPKILEYGPPDHDILLLGVTILCFMC